MPEDTTDYPIDDEELAGARSQFEQPEPRAKAFVFACRLSELEPHDTPRTIVCAHDEVALFNIGGELYATSNICPHEQSPLLAAGAINEERLTVTCPLHGWEFDLRTGRQLDGSSSVPTYQVRVVDREVWVEEPGNGVAGNEEPGRTDPELP